MKEKYHLSPTETEIMERLWERQSLNTLLIRLEERKFVKRERRKVWAALSREEFGAEIIGEAVERYFGGDRERAAACMRGNAR